MVAKAPAGVTPALVERSPECERPRRSPARPRGAWPGAAPAPSKCASARSGCRARGSLRLHGPLLNECPAPPRPAGPGIPGRVAPGRPAGAPVARERKVAWCLLLARRRRRVSSACAVSARFQGTPAWNLACRLLAEGVRLALVRADPEGWEGLCHGECLRHADWQLVRRRGGRRRAGPRWLPCAASEHRKPAEGSPEARAGADAGSAERKGEPGPLGPGSARQARSGHGRAISTVPRAVAVTVWVPASSAGAAISAGMAAARAPSAKGRGGSTPPVSTSSATSR